MERSKNSFSIDLGSGPSKTEPAANLTQIAASWDERGNKNGNEELKRKEGGTMKNREELGEKVNLMMMFRNGMQCNFQIAH